MTIPATDDDPTGHSEKRCSSALSIKNPAGEKDPIASKAAAMKKAVKLSPQGLRPI